MRRDTDRFPAWEHCWLGAALTGGAEASGDGNNMASEQEYIGEIIEASTSEFVAESCKLHSPPRFGSFVKTPFTHESGDEAPGTITTDEDDPFSFKSDGGSFSAEYEAAMSGKPIERVSGLRPAIYGVVHSASTVSTESGRRPRAYWKDEEQLTREQPELGGWLLLTDFRAIIVGYGHNGSIRQYLPPQPPKMHTFVYPCTSEEIRLLTSRMDFLRTLADFHNAPADEVVAACVREAAAAYEDDIEFLVRTGKELANLLKDDYDRLRAIMRRVAS